MDSNCSHELFVAPGNFARRVPVVQHRVTRLAGETFLHMNGTQKLPRAKGSVAHAPY